MISAIGFVHSTWLLPVVFISLLVLSIFIWKEWSSRKTPLFYLKLLASILAVVSLACVTLKPTTNVEADASQLAILTENFSKKSLDSLKQANPLLKTINYQASLPLIDSENRPTSIVVLGNGLDAFDLYQLEDYNTTFLKNDSIAGITKLKLTNRATVGSAISINGQYTSSRKGSKLYLESPDGTLLDSIKLEENSKQYFNLSTQAKAPGLFNFNLLEKDSITGNSQRDTIAVEIIGQQYLNILLLNTFPTFETKYLKNFLAQNGHKLVVRNQLSKGRFKYEYFNTESQQSVQLTAKNISNFDIVMLDYQSLKWLSGNQRKVLENAIKNEGLGLFIQPEVSYFNSSNSFNPFKVRRDNVAATSIDSLSNYSFTKWPFYIENSSLTEVIHKKEDRIISAYQRLQLGRIATTTVNNSYYLVLNGNEDLYKQFWSEILTQISKKELISSGWKASSKMATIDESFSFTLRTSLDKPEVQSPEGSIPLRQDVHIKTTWYGKTYPTKRGWNQLQLKNDSTQVFNYFVSSKDNFKTVKVYSNQIANQRILNGNSSSERIMQQKPIKLLWFYILFLVSMAVLWIIPKL